MKNKALLFALLFCSTMAFSQSIPKGTRFIGGNIDLNFRNNKTQNVSTNNYYDVSISPSITHFKKDNFAVSFSLGYGLGINSFEYLVSNSNYSTKTTSHTLSAGLYLRNYKMLSDKLGISVQYGGNLNYLFGGYYTDNQPNNDVNQQGMYLNLSVGPGVIYLLNEKIALEGHTSLVSFHVGSTWSKNTNSFSIGTGLSANPSLGIGIRYFLKQK